MAIQETIKEIDREESKRILNLETSTAPRAMIKKGQSDKGILMGMKMHVNNNSGRRSTRRESTVSDDIIATSSNMSTLEEKAQSLRRIILAGAALEEKAQSPTTDLQLDTPNKSNILKWDAPVHQHQYSKKQTSQIGFKILQDISHFKAFTHKISCNTQSSITLLSINEQRTVHKQSMGFWQHLPPHILSSFENNQS